MMTQKFTVYETEEQFREWIAIIYGDDEKDKTLELPMDTLEQLYPELYSLGPAFAQLLPLFKWAREGEAVDCLMDLGRYLQHNDLGRMGWEMHKRKLAKLDYSFEGLIPDTRFSSRATLFLARFFTGCYLFPDAEVMKTVPVDRVQSVLDALGFTLPQGTQTRV